MEEVFGRERHGELRRIAATNKIDARAFHHLGIEVILFNHKSFAQAGAAFHFPATEVIADVLDEKWNAFDWTVGKTLLRLVEAIIVDLDDRIECWIDRIGRKTLMLVGSIGYIISLSMVAYAFYAGLGSGFLLFFICLFIASHAIGQGAVIWVFISEIFPNQVRATGQSFGSSVHWVFAALITLITPVFLDAKDGIFKDNPWPIFGFFAIFMILQLLFVILLMPETKGVSLEEIEKKLVKQSKKEAIQLTQKTIIE